MSVTEAIGLTSLVNFPISSIDFFNLPIFVNLPRSDYEARDNVLFLTAEINVNRVSSF